MQMDLKSPPEQCSVDFTQTCFIANGLPFVFYDIHLMVDNGNRFFPCEQK
jgi:hypothetical protein